jgi:hypothetical protein
MKTHCIKLIEWLRSTCGSLARATGRKHDPFLVQSMASFNFGGGWRELRLKVSAKHMPVDSSIVLVNEPFGI